MALTLTLTPASGSVSAEITGLSETHGSDRQLRWYVDHRYLLSDTIPQGETEHTTELAPVHSDALHTITVEIYNDTGEILFTTLEGVTRTTLPDIALWDWGISNGAATAEQTAAARQALQDKDLTVLFSRLVWNDLVDKTEALRRESGIPWLTRYGTAEATRMTDPYSSLSAGRFNAMVENIAHNFWSWAKLPAAPGYLGRQTIRGASSVGENNSDWVYGHYLLELAQRLNTMIGVYTDTGDLVRMSRSVMAGLSTYSGLRADPSAAMSRRLAVTLSLQDAGLRAVPTLHPGAAAAMELRTAAGLIAGRWRLFEKNLYVILEVIPELGRSQPWPILAAMSAELEHRGSITLKSPQALTAALNSQASFNASLSTYGLAGVIASVTGAASLYGHLTTLQQAVFGAAVNAAMALETPILTVKRPAPFAQTALTSQLTPAAELGIVRFVLAAAHVTHALSSSAGFGVGQAAPLGGAAELKGEHAADLKMGTPQPVAASTEAQLGSTSRLDKVAYISLAAAITAKLTATAQEGGEPGEVWHQQVGTEVTIWQAYQRRQRGDIVFIDSPPKAAELGAYVGGSLDISAVGFVSKGWEFPQRLPNSKGRILLVHQLLEPCAVDHWGKLKEGEFDLWQTKEHRQRGDLVFIDSPPKQAALSANANGTVTVTAASFVSRGWTFPERLPDADGRILRVSQTLAAVQTNDELEVD